MATSLTSLHRCCQRSARLLVARQRWSSSSASSPPPLRTRISTYLSQHFYDIEKFMNWTSMLKKKKVQKKNAYYGYTEQLYGRDTASAYYILCLKGRFRFVGQSEWLGADQTGKFNWTFLDHKDTPIEEVDMSYTDINYKGVGNLKKQKLQTLKLKGCPEVDDWFLARLHVFEDSLEELDISHCPRITIGGLTALRSLKGLKRLDVSCLPGISNPGLVIILLEEMLPECLITANGYDHNQLGGEREEEQHIERQR